MTITDRYGTSALMVLVPMIREAGGLRENEVGGIPSTQVAVGPGSYELSNPNTRRRNGLRDFSECNDTLWRSTSGWTEVWPCCVQ